MSLDVEVDRSGTEAAGTSSSIWSFVRGRTKHSALVVNAVRVALVVLWLGSWEIAARTVVDPFYYSMPSKIWDKLVIWFTQGTSQGSIWSNIAITLEERCSAS